MNGSGLATIFTVVLISIGVVVGGIVLYYVLPFARAIVANAFAYARDLAAQIIARLDAALGAIKAAITSVKDELTVDGKLRFAGVLVLAVVLLPLELFLLGAVIRFDTAYFETLFPEDITLPLLGDVTAGFFFALFIALLGCALSIILEMSFGLVRVRWHAATTSDALGRLGRTIVLAVFAVLVLVLIGVELNIGNAAYEIQGRVLCATGLATTTTSDPTTIVDPTTTVDPTIAVDPVGGSVAPPTSPQTTTTDLTARAQCVASWNADQSSRETRVSLAVVAFVLSLIFGFIFQIAAGLLVMLTLIVSMLPVAIVAAVSRLVAFVIPLIYFVIDHVLGALNQLIGFLMGGLRHLGVPLPPQGVPPGPPRREEQDAQTDRTGADATARDDQAAQASQPNPPPPRPRPNPPADAGATTPRVEPRPAPAMAGGAAGAAEAGPVPPRPNAAPPRTWDL